MLASQLLPPHKRAWGGVPESHISTPAPAHNMLSHGCIAIFVHMPYMEPLSNNASLGSHRPHTRAQHTLAPGCLPECLTVFLAALHALQPHWHSFCPITNRVLSHLSMSVLAVPASRKVLPGTLCVTRSASISQASAPVAFPDLPILSPSHSDSWYICRPTRYVFTLYYIFQRQEQLTSCSPESSTVSCEQVL